MGRGEVPARERAEVHRQTRCRKGVAALGFQVRVVTRGTRKYAIIYGMPRVSVIIPVYNVAPYLRQCLDSVVNQTLRDIEAVCVDDGSTDGSAAILAEYAARDPRIKVISIPNSGTVVARKRAVAAASGDWCLFLDPDDWIAPETLERMVAAAAASGADVVQCGFVIEETEPRPAELRAKSESYFNRPAGIHAGKTLLSKIYQEKTLAWNLIGRMARAEICKPAFGEQADAYSINETDVYATFHLMPRVRSLEVISDRLYHYRYGVGISTAKRLALGSFLRTMGKLDTWRELVDFASRRFPGRPAERAIVDGIGRTMAVNLFTSISGRIGSPSDRAAAMRELLARCPHGLLADALAERYANNPSALAEAIDRTGGLPALAARSVRRVGMLYFHLTVGGVQRVVVEEIEALRARGVETTLFLDDNGEDVAVPLPEGVEVVRLPKAVGAGAAPAGARMRALASALEAHAVDVLHSHQYLTERMIWDILAAKLVCGIPFFVHYHSVRTAPLWAMPAAATYCNEPYWLRQCDGVFALTPFDAALFVAEGVRARCIPNPASDRVRAALAAPLPDKDGRLVLWVGRLSEEKHPGDAVRAFGALHRADPGLRFALVGGGPEKLEAHLRQLAAAEGVGGAVEFAGQVDDPSPWYERASVLVSTSDYEGFSLVAQEALANGVPVVSYEQPQLPIFRDNPAVVQVRPRCVADMVAAVLDLLSRDDLPRVHEAARASVRLVSRDDMATALLDAFSGGEVSPPTFSAGDLRDFLQIQRRALASLHSRRTRQIKALVAERDALRARTTNKET